MSRQKELFIWPAIVLILLCSSALYAQPNMITGIVSDNEGEVLPGVSIVLKGTNTGTITDLEGTYRIEAVPGDILVFSFVGYQTQEISVGAGSEVNVILAFSTEALDEVVVVGYGIQKKESIVGAISQAKGDEIKKMNVPDVTNALTGLVPGLVTIQTSGVPGGSSAEDKATKMYIRGLSTWNGGGPLTLIDGVERSIEDVDPNEIENISVLKDASATAVFGVKGANGVILITTKRGRESKPRINFEAQTTLSDVSKVYHPLDAYEANLLKNQAILNELNISESSWGSFNPQQILEYYETQEYPDLFPDVNWYEEMTRKFATAYQFNLNTRGGSDFVKYFGSVSYLHEGDILKGEDLGQGFTPGYRFDRINFRSNLDFDLSQTTKLSANFSGSFGSQDNPRANAKSIWWGVYGLPPDVFPVSYSDGVLGENPAGSYPNPYRSLNYGGQETYNRSQLFTDLILDQKLDFITRGLSVAGKVSVDNYFQTQGPTSYGVNTISKYINPEYIEAPPGTDISQYTSYEYPGLGPDGYNFVQEPVTYNPERISGGSRRKLFYQLSMNYIRSFGNHEVSALALMNREEFAAGSDFKSKREDWVARVTYNYGAKYLFEFNGAYNGSEKFDREYRFGFFPSYAVGWLVSNEQFFQNRLPFINTFKVRYSNGKVGSDAGVERWLYVGDWVYADLQWKFGDPSLQNTGYPIFLEGKIPNATARWETAIKNNIGIESGWFNNSLRINFDYFWEHRVDMLIRAAQRTSNVIFGADLPSANIGEVETHGYEVELAYNYFNSKKLNLWGKFNLAYAVDKILERDDPPLTPDYKKLAGHQIGQTLDYKNTTILENWNEVYGTSQWTNNSSTLPGDYGIVDYNADGMITEDDVVPVGYPERPQYSYSFSFGGNYGGLRASVLFYGVFNVNRLFAWSEFNQGYALAYPIHQEAWIPGMELTEDVKYRALRYSTLTNQTMFGSNRLMDASYLRLQNVEIAYDFNKSGWIDKLGLSNLSLYLRGNNLFIWTDMFEDRDANGESNGSGQGSRSYPVMKRFTAGLVINF